MPLTPPVISGDALQLPPDVLDRYVGVYALDGGGTVTVTRGADGLNAAATGLGSAPLYARSSTEFFVRVIPVSVTFTLDPHADEADGLILHYAGRHTPGRRAKQMSGRSPP